MTIAYCKICEANQQIQADLDPRQVLIPLVCGHSFNHVTGECYTPEQMTDKEAILCETINELIKEAREKKAKAISILEDIL